MARGNAGSKRFLTALRGPREREHKRLRQPEQHQPGTSRRSQTSRFGGEWMKTQPAAPFPKPSSSSLKILCYNKPETPESKPRISESPPLTTCSPAGSCNYVSWSSNNLFNCCPDGVPVIVICWQPTSFYLYSLALRTLPLEIMLMPGPVFWGQGNQVEHLPFWPHGPGAPGRGDMGWGQQSLCKPFPKGTPKTLLSHQVIHLLLWVGLGL